MFREEECYNLCISVYCNNTCEEVNAFSFFFVSGKYCSFGLVLLLLVRIKSPQEPYPCNIIIWSIRKKSILKRSAVMGCLFSNTHARFVLLYGSCYHFQPIMVAKTTSHSLFTAYQIAPECRINTNQGGPLFIEVVIFQRSHSLTQKYLVYFITNNTFDTPQKTCTGVAKVRLLIEMLQPICMFESYIFLVKLQHFFLFCFWRNCLI